MEALPDDGVGATSGLPGLPGADGEGAADEGEQHELGCSFIFYFIQDAEDEEGLTTGKVRTAPPAAPTFACLCLKRWHSRDLRVIVCAAPLPRRTVQGVSDLLPCGPIRTVESFWAYYSHILKPSDFPANFDVCFFKEGCQPLCDDPANTGGGRWTARLRKGQTARIWEDLLLAMVAGASNVHTLLQGAVVSMRADDDVLAIWSEHTDRTATLQLRQVLLKILNLPKNVIFEYKRHGTYKPPKPSGLKYSIGEMQQIRTECKEVGAALFRSPTRLCRLVSPPRTTPWICKSADID